jgi:hypothetical protein
MKNQWMAYVVVVAISALAGLAIAGPPNNVAAEPTIVVSATTVPTTTVAPATTETTPTTTVPAETTTTTTTAAAETTTTAPESTTTTEPAVNRANVIVVAVNGAGTQGLATRVSDELIAAGFVQTRATDGATLVDDTVVYFFPSFEREAAEVAAEIGLELADVRPIEEAPAYGVLDGDQVVVYLGRDRS